MYDIQIILSVLSGVSLFLLILIIILYVKMNNMRKKYALLMQGSEDKNLEDMFIKRLDVINKNVLDLEKLAKKQQYLEHKMQGCVQKVGIIRFNAYNDIAGDLSYAMAVLDEYDNGLVLSGLISRTDMRCYAKAILNNKSAHVLTEEEQIALKVAKEKYTENKSKI